MIKQKTNKITDQPHHGIFEADVAAGACAPGAAAAEVCGPGAVIAWVCEPGAVAAGTVDGSADANTLTTKRANIKGTAATTKHFENRFDRVTPFPSFL
jgi:hypothetical protein